MKLSTTALALLAPLAVIAAAVPAPAGVALLYSVTEVRVAGGAADDALPHDAAAAAAAAAASTTPELLAALQEASAEPLAATPPSDQSRATEGLTVARFPFPWPFPRPFPKPIPRPGKPGKGRDCMDGCLSLVVLRVGCPAKYPVEYPAPGCVRCCKR